MEAKIKEFKEYLQNIEYLKGALSLMMFDGATGAPKGGIKSRAARMGYIGGEIFSMEVSPQIEKFINALSGVRLDTETAAMLRIVTKRYEQNKKIPKELVRNFRQLCAESNNIWEKAKHENNYKLFAPYLDKLIKTQKEILELRGNGTYNILLDDYEENLTIDECDIFFKRIKSTIIPLLKKVIESKKEIDISSYNLAVPIAQQRKISEFLANKVGFDLNRGMIRESIHPFCNGTDQDDVRITTNYNDKNFLFAFFSVLHECGHAIYEQNTAKSIANTLLDKGVSMGVHESQSRFYENIIGRSLPFWQHITDELKELLPSECKKYTPEDFYKIVNIAKPSLIRVEADELTYSLHIIIRYEMERLIFEEDIDIQKLPEIWNEKMREYIGVTPMNDSEGILQDVHWSEALFGYFPSYSLGSALSSQFMHYIEKDINVNNLLQKGDIAPITSWLTKNIHTHGCIYTPKEIVKNTCGEDLNPDYYTKYLTDKFTSIYNL